MTVTKAIEAAGFGDVLAARRARDEAALFAARERLAGADLMILGALADRVRTEEVGDDVRIFTGDARTEVGVLVLGREERGLPLLRRVALARITGPHRARVRVDWAGAGLEIAQVALGFGANELEGPIANKRGLPIAEDAVKKVKGQGMVAVAALKKIELEGLIRRAGRTPIFEAEKGHEATSLETEARP